MGKGDTKFDYHGFNNAMKDIIMLPDVADLCGSSANDIQAGARRASLPIANTACEYYIQPYKSSLGNTCYIVGTKNWASMRRNAKDDTLLKGLKYARK